MRGVDGVLLHTGFATVRACSEQEGGIFPFCNDLRGELVNCLSDTDLKKLHKWNPFCSAIAHFYPQILLKLGT